MQKLSKKSGSTLIEVLCALAIISIMCSLAMSIHVNNLKLMKYNQEKRRYISTLEAIKEDIICNLSYSDIINVYNQNKKFVKRDNLTLSEISKSGVLGILEESINLGNTYVKLDITQGEVLKIELQLNLKLKTGFEVIKTEFYKGNYL